MTVAEPLASPRSRIAAGLLAGLAVEVSNLDTARAFYDRILAGRGGRWQREGGTLTYRLGSQHLDLVRRGSPRTFSDGGHHCAIPIEPDRLGPLVEELSTAGHAVDWWREDHTSSTPAVTACSSLPRRTRTCSSTTQPSRSITSTTASTCTSTRLAGRWTTIMAGAPLTSRRPSAGQPATIPAPRGRGATTRTTATSWWPTRQPVSCGRPGTACSPVAPKGDSGSLGPTASCSSPTGRPGLFWSAPRRCGSSRPRS